MPPPKLQAARNEVELPKPTQLIDNRSIDDAYVPNILEDKAGDHEKAKGANDSATMHQTSRQRATLCLQLSISDNTLTY
ncbi:hypothetical protein LTR37_017202 [Vermiconidia calcicola]|uniref:Uncharacterized protein n=1 Tax=Vermiconidia calcicola TaxID=1690605 RepID=A0ACC3MKQ3_9PEZI|nr:hypothetical protein LTR37_017202 [Vermiconidia calcicola]